MASHSATMAATARAAEARDDSVDHGPPAEPSPFLSGRRAAAAGVLVLAAVGLLLMPALLAAGLVLDATVVGRAAVWLEWLTLPAPGVLAVRALVAVMAVVAIARSDGQG